MSIDVDLLIEENLEPPPLMLRISELMRIPLGEGDKIYDKEADLFVRAHKIDKYDEWGDLYMNFFNDRPKTRVSFRGFKGDHERSQRLLMVAIIGLLKELSGNFIVIFVDIAVLSRADGSIVIDRDWLDDISIEMLEKSGLDYEITGRIDE